MSTTSLTRALAVSCLTLAMFPGDASAASTPAWSSSITLHRTSVPDGSGRPSPVTYVQVDLRDPHILVEPVVASDQFGRSAPLSSLAQRDHAVAAINGTYFNAYSDLWPQGTLELDGQFEHLDGASLLGVGYSGQLVLTRATESITLSLHHSWTWPDVLYPSAINAFSGKATQISILTRLYGSMTPNVNGISVIVEHGVVTRIRRGSTPIPSAGYAVEFGLSPYNLARLAQIHVGNAVSYRVTVRNAQGQSIDFSAVRSAIGAGPLLVDHGRITYNPRAEGFTDPKVLNSSGPKSFFGIDHAGRLILAAVPNATGAQLARIAFNMHLVEAMNGDGGASSGLFWNGSYLASPGRNLSNALVVKYVDERPVEPAQNAQSILSMQVKDQADRKRVSGDNTGALALYLKASEVDSTNVDAIYAAAMIYEQQSDWPDSATWLQRTVQLDPYKFDAWNTLGWVQYRQHDYTSAVATFTQLQSLEPKSPVPWFDLGQCYASYALKQYGKARLDLQRAVQVDPTGSTGQAARRALSSLPSGS